MLGNATEKEWRDASRSAMRNFTEETSPAMDSPSARITISSMIKEITAILDEAYQIQNKALGQMRGVEPEKKETEMPAATGTTILALRNLDDLAMGIRRQATEIGSLQ